MDLNKYIDFEQLFNDLSSDHVDNETQDNIVDFIGKKPFPIILDECEFHPVHNEITFVFYD